MILQRFFEDAIAQASFLVGCPASGEAVVIDPTIDVQQYIDAAARERLRIVGVTETHIHADYLSGSLALAHATGARLYVSGEGGPDWQYAFAGRPNVTVLRDGDTVPVGRGRLEVRHTPGHTPEHLTFVLVDAEASAEPLAAFTGDFIFAGDVGRPDLLERAAGHAGTMAASARQLWRSLSKTAPWHDGLLLYPGHGAGSACGKSLGGMPVTSMGYERRANWAFEPGAEEAFVEAVLSDQPEPPAYFAEMKRINKLGHAALDGPPAHLRVADVAALGRDVLVLDVRPAEASGDALVEGSIAIPFDRSLAKYAGSVIPLTTAIVLLAPDAPTALAAWRALALIGFDRMEGWVGPELVDAARADGRLTRVVTIAPDVLGQRLAAGGRLIDVRGAAEFKAGAIPGARNVPLGALETTMAKEDRSAPVVVHCQTGVRAHIASTLLGRLGYRDVSSLEGGYAAWAQDHAQAAETR
jgi:hydroxyacylglutathione hydrolase